MMTDDQRIGTLEGWSQSADRRFDEIGRRMDKQDTNLQRIWERLDLHRDGQVKTQTLVEVGNRDVAELKVQMAQNATTQQDILQTLSAQNVTSLKRSTEQDAHSAGKWENFYSKAFWIIVTGVATYFGYSLFK